VRCGEGDISSREVETAATPRAARATLATCPTLASLAALTAGRAISRGRG
jgi:hypothetical protein